MTNVAGQDGASPDGASADGDLNDLVTVGRVGPVWGLHGAVYVQPLTDDVELRFADGAQLLTEPPERGPLTVAKTHWHGQRFVVHFEAVTDRQLAAELRGTELLIRIVDRPPLEDPDDFYDTDLVGLQALQPDGTVLGPVTDVVHSPAGEYLLIRIDDRDRLVPFVRAIVPEVRLSAGTLIVDPPEGLFEL